MNLSCRRILLLFICLTGINLSTNSQDIPEINAEFETTLNSPQRVTKINDGHYLVDFGKAFFGTVKLISRNHQQEPLILHLGEKLKNPDSIDRNPGGTIRFQSVKIPNLEANKIITVELSSDKRNTSPPAIILPDSFGIVMPFRYCEVENLKVPFADIEIWQEAQHYRFNDEAASFTSSDTILNAIWELCKHTVKATSFAGYYIDGDRERIPYEADAYINQLSHYSIDTVYSLARRTNEYFIDHPTWPTEWILHTAMMFYADYQYTGDLSPIAKHYHSLKVKALIELSREDGLISTASTKMDNALMTSIGFSKPGRRLRDIVDWPQAERDNYDMLEINTVVNAFYFNNLKIMSTIAGALGEIDDSVMYMAKADQVKNTINKKLFDRSKGLYIDGEGSDHSSLHANMFPLAFDLVPEECIPEVLRFVKSKGMACSVYGAQFLLEALLKNGEYEYAIDLITDTESKRAWWNMIKTGSTMTLEAWDIEYKSNLDWNHAWGTAPLNIITRYLWGIKPIRAGFSTVQIKPQLESLKSTKIKIPTINGTINASYRMQNNSLIRYEIEIPEDMSAQFIISDPEAEIRHNNKKITKRQTILLLNSGLNIIESRN